MTQLAKALVVLTCVSIFGSLSVAQELAVESPFKKVLIVVLENTDFDQALKQPFLNRLAKEGALLTNMHGEGHPSQGNYIALTSGSTHGVKSDWNHNLNVKHIGDLLESHGLSWKVYAENYPGNCFLGRSKRSYVRKHNPFVSYVDIQKDKKRCNDHIVNAKVLDEDVQNQTLSEYSFYVPNLKNDGHDTSVCYADKWLQKRFGDLLNDERFMKDMLFIVTFDEDDGTKSNRIYSALYGPGVVPGSVSSQRNDHYSMLRTIEEAFGTGTLGQKDDVAQPITGIWKDSL